ncbi:MAG: ATP-binding cassette domain-containing protein, partial [Microvirga sp.]
MDARTTQALLYVDGVSVSFDGFRALNNLSLVMDPGEMRAIIGPNGAGKTTMMDVITGKTRADTGLVMFQGGVDLKGLDETAIARLGVGRKFQKPTVFEALTVAENLALALQGGLGLLPLLRGGRGAVERERIGELLDLTGL